MVKFLCISDFEVQ